MERSENITNIAAALLTFDGEVSKISKESTNPFFKNKYAPLPDILEAIKTPLQKAKLTVKQFPTGEYCLTTLILHESGEYLMDTYKMNPAKNDPQGEGSRITYQRRYALGAMLGLNIDVDDDGNKASGNEDNRPWIKENMFDNICERITKGEKGLYQQIIDMYRMKNEYREKLDKLVK